MQRVWQGLMALRGAVSAQTALQESKTGTKELLEGLKDNNIVPNDGSIDLPSWQSNDFFKRPIEKMS